MTVMNGHSGQHSPSEPVAIVGMACRYAGGVRDPPGLWKLLKEKRDAWREFNDARAFTAEGFHHPNHERPGSMTTRGGYLLEEDPRLFDPGFFGISGREVETMDPSQRKLLEVVYEAVESGGESWESISGSRTGVYIGNFAADHLLIQSRDWEDAKPYSATGADSSILANRISYIFNLQGPSLVTTTACSSSMYALHLAVQAIRNDECDSAIVAAANCILDPTMQMVLDKLGALSPTSRCHTFDVAADGYARGEGYAALYLRKTSLAVAQDSPIRAMIRGTAVNANGRTGGIARPQADGQEAVIRKAYENAGGLRFSDTSFFECHGTGTQAGDPIEISAVGNVFGPSRSDAPEDRLLVGAVKTNLGHTEGASAIASVIKVVLSLEAGEIPPSYGVNTLNPAIDFAKAKVEVVRDGAVPWPKDKIRRASINSFGFGGANGHCIIDHVNVLLPDYVKPGIASQKLLQARVANAVDHKNGEPPSTVTSPTKLQKADALSRELVLLPFSAHSVSSLQLNIKSLAQVIEQQSLADVAYTLALKRSRFQHRCFRIVSKDDPKKGLTDTDGRIFSGANRLAAVGFIFTGQGAQWHGMGSQLLDYAEFGDTISYLDQVMRALESAPCWSIRDILTMSCEEGRIHAADVAQTVCTAVQIGIVDLLASWNVRPAAVVGHSSGEIAASYASGYLTAAEAITVAYLRGQAVSSNKQKGAMLAVGLGPDRILPYLDDKQETIKVAAINSPDSVTISGDICEINEISTILTKEEIFNRPLRTGGNAYHSHHMQDISECYSKALSYQLERTTALSAVDKGHRYPQVRWVSSVRPKEPIPDSIPPSYWKDNLESPVRFCDAVSNLLSDKTSHIDVLVEIGPHPSLKSPLDRICKSLSQEVSHVSSLRRGEDARASMLKLAGSLFGLNAAIDLVAVNAVDDQERKHGLIHGCTAINLPPYQYTYQSVKYYESRPSKEFRLRKVPRHDLLGVRVPGTAKFQPQWRNMLTIKNIPWLSEHRLSSEPCFPVSGFVAMAMEAASQTYQEVPGSLPIAAYTIKDMCIKSALVIPEDERGIEIVLSITTSGALSAKPTAPAWCSFTISTVNSDSDEWTEHCTGRVRVEVTQPVSLDKLTTNSMDSRFPDVRAWYRQFRKLGIEHGPTFQTLFDLTADPRQNMATGRVALSTTAGSLPGGESSYIIHPTALDGMFQLGLIACAGGQVEEANTAFVPLHLARLYLKARVGQDSADAIAHSTVSGNKSANLHLQLLNKAGEVVIQMRDLTFIKYGRPAECRGKAFSSPFSRLSWKPHFPALNNTQFRRLFPPPQENMERIGPLERVDKIVALVLFDIYDEFLRPDKNFQPPSELEHWVSWARRTIETDQREAMVQARELSTEDRQELLKTLYDAAGDDPESKAAKILHANMGDILHGKKTSLEVLVPDGLLTAMYQEGHMLVGAYPQLSNALRCLGHASPRLRILEIGAGTGGATRVAMRALSCLNGIKSYASYTFTDISPGFLTSAKSSLEEFPDMEFSILDIEQDPEEQGYGAVYDVVLASQSIHATASMKQTLANCRKLLKPGGRLILVESTRTRVLAGLLYGTMTGYWLGIDDDRSEGPFMSIQKWDRRLKEVGFSGVELTLDDYPEPFTTTSVIVSTFAGDMAQQKHINGVSRNNELVHILYGAGGEPLLLASVSHQLAEQGIRYNPSPLDKAMDLISEGARVIAFLDDENLLLDLNGHQLAVLQHLARNCKSMIWLTSTGLVRGQSPDGALVTGLLRTLGTENPTSKFASIDINSENFDVQESKDELARAIVNLELSLQTRGTGLSDTIDREFSWEDGCLWSPRVVPDDRLNKYAERLRSPENSTFDMAVLGSQGPLTPMLGSTHSLKSLYFQPSQDACQPLRSDQIEVQVFAVSLSPRDEEEMPGKLPLGFSGVVSKVGEAVTALSPNTLVWGVTHGPFSNYVRVPATFVQKLKLGCDFAGASTIPVPYMTAMYALEHLARIKKGQRLLILSGAGHVELAAIRFAQLRGAEVFATAKTPDDACILADSASLPLSHILSLNDLAALLQKAISGVEKRFSVVLVTSATDFIEASLDALVPMGHLISVCEQELKGYDLTKKQLNLSTFTVDHILKADPELVAQLMKAVDIHCQQGDISPLFPVVPVDVSELSQALPADVNSGRIVVKFMNSASLIKRAPATVRFDPQAVYIISGGFGGLGRAFVRWMFDRGAQGFLLLSRQGANTPEAKLLVQSLESAGARVIAPTCDVSDRKRVLEVIQEASKYRPVKGVIHAALSLSDISFDKLTMDQWRNGIAAKVNGTKHLHEATRSLPLDFFIMTTSTETIWAPPTQSVYMAASNFQDHFARYRRRLGLPASTIAYGLVNDVKSDWKDASSGTVSMYERNKALTISEHGVLAALEMAFLDNGTTHVAPPSQSIDHDPLSDANIFTCLDPSAMAIRQEETAQTTTSTSIPKWYSDGKVSLIIGALEDAQRLSNSNKSTEVTSESSQSAIARIRQTFEETYEAAKEHIDEHQKLVEFVSGAISKALSDMLFIDILNINPENSIAGHGVDSLIAAELRNWFHQAFGISIMTGKLLDADTGIKDLAAEIVGHELTPLETSHESDKDFTLSTPESIIFASNGSCALSYQATVGNQYVAGEYIRHHVTEGQSGVPLTILLEILDWNTCEPVEDVFVEVWSCNATGVYGGISTGNDTSDMDNTMLRGVQQTDSEGVVTFDTIFPGHYSVRANHIHLMVHTKAAASAKNGTLLDLSASYVGQVFFDQDLVYEVEALPAYAANKQILTLNENDGLVKKELEAGSNPFMDYVRLGHDIEDGLLAWYTFGVDMSTRIHATPAAYLHHDDDNLGS
ncbi:Compactin diketide synthase mokB [Fusarium proliferatum]|uniref:Compactin diketide synthase mokB n=1 Tax=Gibberella intermedia TaxID=948311 RepID=A0A420TIN4_GIBIN|nr:Compactin diketide synthase mokB [Fusarium proliferatum]